MEPDYDNPDPENCFTLCQDLRSERSTIGIKERAKVFGDKIMVDYGTVVGSAKPIRGRG